MDNHIIVPCVVTDGGRLFAADPIVNGMEVEFQGWWWTRLGNDPAWPHGVFSMKRQGGEHGERETEATSPI